jgi:hypothetical protein
MKLLNYNFWKFIQKLKLGVYCISPIITVFLAIITREYIINLEDSFVKYFYVIVIVGLGVLSILFMLLLIIVFIDGKEKVLGISSYGIYFRDYTRKSIKYKRKKERIMGLNKKFKEENKNLFEKGLGLVEK